MKYLFQLFIFLLTATAVPAQVFSLNDVSEKIDWRVGVGNFTALPNSDFLSVSYDGGAKLAGTINYSGDVVLRWYLPNLKEQKTITFPVRDLRADIGLLSVYSIGNKKCLLYTQTAADDKLINLQCVELDSSSLQPKQPVTIATFQSDGKPFLRLVSSPNGKYLLVKVRRYLQKTEYIEYFQFDNQFKNLRTIKYQLPEEQSIRAQDITNAGEVFVIFQNNFGKRDEDCFIHKFEGTSSATPQKIQVMLESKSANFIRFWQNRVDNKYYLLGAYMGDSRRYNGFFFTEVPNRKQAVLIPTVKEFDGELLSALDKDGFAHRKKGLDYNWGGRNMLTRDDGSMDLVFEYNELYQAPPQQPRYISGSVLDIHFKDGIIQFNRIPKSQSTFTTNSYNSIYSYTSGNKLVLLYNEVKRNLDEPIQSGVSTWSDPKKTVLVSAIVDDADKITRQMIWDNGEGNYASEPAAFVGLKNNNVLVIQSKIGFTNFKYRMAILGIK